MNNINKYDGYTKEEILSSSKLRCGKKGEYNILLLFPNKICPNENFKSMIVVGYSGNKFEIIGECIDIRDFTKEKYIIGYTSINAIMLTSYNSKFQVYGLPKEPISHYLDLFTKEE